MATFTFPIIYYRYKNEIILREIIDVRSAWQVSVQLKCHRDNTSKTGGDIVHCFNDMLASKIKIVSMPFYDTEYEKASRRFILVKTIAK